MGKWIEETEFTHHYFADEKDADDPKRITLIGDAMVEKGRSDVFGGLWYGVILGPYEPDQEMSRTGNFSYLNDAKKWVEKQVAADAAREKEKG